MVAVAYRNTGIRVGPENIAQKSSIRDIARTSNVGDLIHLAEFGGQSTVHANDLVVNDRATRQAIKGVAKLLPHFHGKATTAFVVKPINTIDARAFVVSAQQEKVLRILYFVGE